MSRQHLTAGWLPTIGMRPSKLGKAIDWPRLEVARCLMRSKSLLDSGIRSSFALDWMPQRVDRKAAFLRRSELKEPVQQYI
jgi:hypothetical protein